MNQKGIYSVGARLLGLYFLVCGLSLLPTAYAAVSAARSVVDEVGVPFGNAFTLASTAHALLLVAAGLILLVWKRGVHPVAASFDPGQVLVVGLKLLGAFFIVSGASDVIWGVMRGSLAPAFTFADYSKAVAGAFALGAGLMLWVRARPLSSLPRPDR